MTACYLHIGTEKTGTTTLQRFLHINRQTLRARGYFVPTAFGEGNHRGLTTYAMRDDKIDDGRKIRSVLDSAAVPAHRKALYEAFAAEAGQYRDCANAVLSSEHCHSRLFEVAEVRRLKALLDDFFDEVVVIVYLRPQHELAVSLYSTALRVGYVDPPILPALQKPTPYFDYDRLLRRWAEVFGAERVRPRIFAGGDLRGDNIVDDFCTELGLDAAELRPVPRGNRELSENAQAFLASMNQFLPMAHADPTEVRAELVRLLEAVSPGEGRKPARREVERFMALFAETNERVRRDWFPDRTALFDVDFGSYPATAEASGLSRDCAMQLFASIWTEFFTRRR